MSRTFCLLLLLAPHGVLLTSQMEELHVTFISPEFPTLKVKADCSDDDPSGGPMKIRVYPCIRKSRRLPDTTEIWGVCKEDGVKVCLSPLLRDEECVIILGRKGDVTYKSPELSLTNVTFLNRTNLRVKTTPWKQQGNTSVIRLQPVVGVPIYTLRLEGDGNNKNSNCNTVFLTGDTEESFGEVVFTVHWHQQVDPGCTYRVWLMAKDECQEDMVYTYDMNLSELQYIQPSDETIVLEGPKDRIIFLVAAGAAASFILIAVALLFVFTYQTKKYRRISCEPQRPTPVTGREVAPSPRPTVLLVYTPNLHPKMAALAARLKEMTGLQIEDLNDVGDQDKLNDPTVWVTRRLMDANTRFVLPCSTVHHDNEELEEGGAVHFLLDHFLQYLRSSRLAYDYTRLHLIRLEDEPHVEVRDVTPGRVYRLPADLPQMAHNLTLATPTTSTSPQGTLEEAC